MYVNIKQQAKNSRARR